MYLRSSRIVLSLAAAVALACFFTGCGAGESESQAPGASIPAGGDSESLAGSLAANSVHRPAGSPEPAALPEIKVNLYPEVVFKTSEGTIKVKLNREKAPMTVENFLNNYVEKGSYDNTIFHQVEKGFMALAGAFTPDLQAKTARAQIRSEADNGLKNLRGTIAMARDPAFQHTASNQFFFNLADNPELDHVSRESTEDYGYCVFGEVVEGVEALERISQVPVQDQEKFPSLPVKTVVIESVRQVP